MKKINLIWLLGLIFFNGISTCLAEDTGGKIILDLQSDRAYQYDHNKFMPDLLQKGYNFIHDVKQYNEQLDGDNIERDFSEDLSIKYPEYSIEAISGWQNYVRKGVKVMRFFEDAKQAVKKWIMDYELPIVAEDSQYEMGEDEQYIESDTPIIKENFKKIISYSNSPKDKLAIREKYAKDHNLTRPSQMIKWYRENIAQGNWKKLFKSLWKDPVAEEKEIPHVINDHKDAVYYEMMMKNNGIDNDGKIEGVISITPPENQIILLSDYKDFNGIKLDFAQSENLQDIRINFVLPQELRTEEKRIVLFYGSQFPIYFSGKAKNPLNPIKLKLDATSYACQKDTCSPHYNHLKLDISPVGEIKPSQYAHYVNIIRNNIPDKKNKNKFKIYGLFSEKRGNSQGIRLEFSSNNNTRAKAYMIGKEASHFAAPKISLRDNRIKVWFELLDSDFDYTDKEITFWLSEGSNTQYLTKQKIKSENFLNAQSSNFSLNILWLAILGGFLLNFMPCVFPVLSLKLLAFTKFGGLNERKIKLNFFLNCLGIGCAFFIIAILLSSLKLAGIALGWGMQFQSVCFITAIIWVVTYFLAYVMGIVRWNEQKFLPKTLKSGYNQEKMFEFLSGLFMVALSTPCMAPYLGTALGIALAGSPVDIILTVMCIGIGLAIPYIIIATFPKIAFYIPRPGKWLNLINTIMITMLIITLIWLVSLLASQLSYEQIWHWTLYIIIALILWQFCSMLQKEVDKLKDNDIKSILRKRYAIRKLVLTALLIIISFADVKWHDYQRSMQQTQNTVLDVNLKEIEKYVNRGNKVLVKIGADWCLTCQYNETFVFNLDHIQDELLINNIIVMSIDWTDYNEQVLHFMQKFGRQGLPFYVLFSPAFPEGIVLPEILNKNDFSALIRM